MKMDGVTVQTRFTIKRYPRRGSHHPNWRVYDGEELVCVCLYLKGAEALVERLIQMDKQRQVVAE